ncbi:hypothetical protein BDV28DRAFT_144365 [Aspergillus coremiiformis]|uniref:Uncharacterized protein n=1 Tax=Aspergillus coremiiformis TaxID=138285 RepID=A0A5N6YRF5_9EURO|nr:hypothetical protein BDV28DRAFT_144365 [Aspergillus coremiiformis]
MESTNEDSAYAVEDYRMAIRTAHLEKEYNHTLVCAAQLLDAEKSRIQRVEQLILEFENETLRWQLKQINQELTKTARVESEVRLQLHETWKELNYIRIAHRDSSHEIGRLRHKLTSLNNDSVDSKKLLAEKNRLTKDLSNAEADIGRSKSQQTAQHTFIAEKQTLEQRLTTLELRLECEKKTHKQTLARGSQKDEEIAALSSKLEETRNELIVEKQAHEHAIQQQSIEWAAQRTSLEAKLDALTKQLRSTEDQNQVATTELQRLPNTSSKYWPGNSGAQTRIVSSPQLSTAEHNSSLTIATPGAIHAQGKRKKTSALPGDKSFFSITPFLNRQHGLRHSPTSSEGDTNDLHTARIANKANESPLGNGAKKGLESGHQGRTGPVDGPVTAEARCLGQGTCNAKKKGRTQRKLVDISDADERREESTDIFNHNSNHEQPKSKKRKLGIQRDRGFFDGEDEEDIHDIRQPGRKLVLGSGRNLASQISAPSGGRLGRGRGLAEFSPLKRNKKRPVT